MTTVLSKNVINRDNTHELGLRIKKNWSKFDLSSFEKEIVKNLPLQGLGERIQQVRVSLYNHLPKDYNKSLNILLMSLPPILHNDAFDSKLDLSSQNGFIMISLTAFVSRYGLDQYKISMSALKEMTKRFSAEGSIRYFIEKYPVETLKLYNQWAKDDSPHVRRLVSESTRPRLPMTMALPIFKKNPNLIIPLLEELKNDPELIVRRSVANNLNDISKDNPVVVTKLLKLWKHDRSKEMDWLIKHALRTLEKQGDPKALKILGYTQNPKIRIEKFKLKSSEVVFGNTLEFEIELISTSKIYETLVIDYIIYHMKAHGKLKAKTFKLSKKSISAVVPLSLKKKHSMRKISTRVYYPGLHEIHIQINGKIYAKKRFTLIM